MMLKEKTKRRRASVLIPCLGVLLATSCLSSVSLAQESQGQGAAEIQAVQGLENISQDIVHEIDGLFETGDDHVPDVAVAEEEGVGASGFQNGYETQDLVLAVYAKKKRLSPGLFAVQHNGQYYLPVAALSEVLGFYYEVDSSSQVVEGWALSEKDSFSIDAQNNVLRFRGDKFDLPSGAILDSSIAGDDIYALIDVFPQIWPLELDVNLSSLVLKVLPDGQLPFELALLRKTQRDRALLERESREKEESFPFVPYPYQLYSKPTIDISSLVGYEEVSDQGIANLSINGVNDFAYASADYSVSMAQTGGEFRRPENIRFRLRRQNIHDGALPFGLEDTQLGDVRLKNRELISNGASGRGFTFTNEKNKKVGEFDLVTIEGIGTPGWEVELYLNNELINFSVVDEVGEYRFEDISVGYGNNRFRIVLYGPQGQIKERVENYVYQSSMVKKGDTVFSGGVLDANRDLIPIEERKTGRAEGLTANVYASHGLTERLTGFFTASTVRDREGREEISREYVTAGGIGSIGSNLVQVEGYKEVGGGHAVDVRTLSDFMGFKVNTQVSKFYDFESPDAQSGSTAKDLETEISVKKIFKTLIGSLGLEFRNNYQKRQSGPDTSKYVTRQSLGLQSFRMTNTTTTDLLDGDHQNTTGRFSTSSRQNSWNLRNTVNYSIYPDTELTSIQSELRYGRQREYMTGIQASYDLVDDEARLGFQISKDFKKFLGSAQTEWSSDHGIGFSLRASTSLGPFEEDDGYLFRSTPLTNTGAVGSFLYNDKNYNNVYDEGDLPVPEGKIIYNRRITRDGTNENGYITELLASAAGRTNTQVAKESLKDPYLIPAVEGYNIHPRAGVVHRMEFPLIETGAIDGTLKWGAEGEPIAGVNLQLLNEQADVIQTTKTAVDGYYTFERVPPGNYTIRPDPEDGLDIPFKYVNLTTDNLFQFGTDVLATSDGSVQPVDLGVEVAKDGSMNVNDIVSLVKGYKEKRNKNIHKAAVSNTSKPAMVKKASLGGADKPVVNSIRIGDHPNKVRVVMDLSAPLEYSIAFEPQSNSVFIEMPYAHWSASDQWNDKVKEGILNNYTVETMGQGIRLILGVENGVDIGASGLLKANGDKKDRLYIDIEKK